MNFSHICNEGAHHVTFITYSKLSPDSSTDLSHKCRLSEFCSSNLCAYMCQDMYMWQNQLPFSSGQTGWQIWQC